MKNVKHKPPNKFETSFRLKKYFNGGGHKLAAGATINDQSIKEINDKIIKLLKRKI